MVKTRSEIIAGFTNQLVEFEGQEVTLLDKITESTGAYDRLGYEIEALKTTLVKRETKVKADIAGAADPATGKFSPELSNAEKRDSSYIATLTADTVYLKTLDIMNAQGIARAEIKRNLDAATRMLQHVGRCQANRRAVLNSLGGTE